MMEPLGREAAKFAVPRAEKSRYRNSLEKIGENLPAKG